MPLFQNTVTQKFLNTQDAAILKARWEKFKAHFHDPRIQENIRESKEEQYQGEFLIDLFVNVLGYTKNPTPDYNLTTEYKNVKDSKKADGAILINDKVKAVIELKGTETTDLNKIEAQAFGYKNNQPDCSYVVTSNFEKLRFYIDNTVDFIDFNLFELDEEQFALLYLCLGYENLSKDLPSKIKKDSLSQEDAITKQLYKDYSIFKRELHYNLVALNPQFDALTLFKKSQKLLDRFLFLFFAEDRLLLPPNSVRLVLSDWRDLMEKDVDTTLYKRFQKYFGYLNTGFKGKRYDVFAYNGGLFKPDEVLQAVEIDDELLYKHTLKLSEYDFESEVDVNILGHIFENSLTEIEEVQAELEGQEIDRTKSKRKKDGVFYTPKYITKYIVENTVGKLCEEKKKELDITDEAYQPAKQRSRKRLDNLQAYRDWLLQITICDPACGSGAFLNQALEFLIAEHRYIDELSAKYNKDSLILSDVENSILENNLFGVDLNEEAVEIAKLSLWLRTAQKNRKLNDLSNNIKCGNSLVDDPKFAGEKAFSWEQEFPEIFLNGGFDIVIGNPPYVRADAPGNDPEVRDYLVNRSKFTTLSGKWDFYIPFIELAHIISSPSGSMSLIIPDAYCHSEYAKSSLETYTLNNSLSSIDFFPEMDVFENVGVSSIIVNFLKNREKRSYTKFIHNTNGNILTYAYPRYPKSFRYDYKDSIIENKKLCHIGDIFYISKGIVGNSDEKKYKGEFKVGDLISDNKDNVHSRLYYEGKNISKWVLDQPRYIEYNTERSPSKWSRKGFPELFSSRKIVTMRSPGKNPRSFIDENEGFFNESAIGFVRWCDLSGVSNNSISQQFTDDRKDKEIISKIYSLEECLGYFNSKLFRYELNADRRSNIHIYPDDWRKLKIPKNPSEKLKIIVLDIINLSNRFQNNVNTFLKYIISQNSYNTVTRKLENWYDLEFSEFIRELKKMNKKAGHNSLSKKEEYQWLEVFEENKVKVQGIQSEIKILEKEIDQMVYELYELTEEEIKIVEKG